MEQRVQSRPFQYNISSIWSSVLLQCHDVESSCLRWWRWRSCAGLLRMTDPWAMVRRLRSNSTIQLNRGLLFINEKVSKSKIKWGLSNCLSNDVGRYLCCASAAAYTSQAATTPFDQTTDNKDQPGSFVIYQIKTVAFNEVARNLQDEPLGVAGVRNPGSTLRFLQCLWLYVRVL